MTSLAQQLKRLALPQTDPSLLVRKDVVSLLFDCKEAANIDRDTFFAIGCNGLEELMGIDPSFETFQATLFSYTSKSLERSVQTKAVNQQLDENISSFLTHLSPYFMLKPAQKCLEWLIHRFHIHLYNQDSLIGCVLPYHETRVFVRVIQLLNIKDPTHRWNWLEPIQKPGVPLARDTLITHCYKDLGFMDFICSLVTKAVKAFAEYSSSAAQLRVLVSFYASTIVSALEAVQKITETIVAKLLPYVQKGLRSSLVDYKAATYMIICQLAVKVVMEPSLVNALATQISKTLSKTPSLIRDGMGCLIVLLQSQGSEGLGKKAFTFLCKVPDLVSILQGIAAIYDTTAMLRYLLPNLVNSIIHFSSDVELEQSEEVDKDGYKVLLMAIFTDVPLESGLDKVVARALLDGYLSYGLECSQDTNKMSSLNNQLLTVVRFLERKYPTSLDLVLEEHLKDVTNQTEQDLFHQFISLSTSGGKYQLLADSDTSLMLSLNHPQPAVRLLALQHLKGIVETSKEGFDESFIREAIFARLADDNLDVVLAALGAFQVFSPKIDPEDKVSSLLNLFRKVDLSRDGPWYQALEKATDLLMEGDMLRQNDKLMNQVVMTVLPYMVITTRDATSSEQKMAVHLAQSDLCALHSLLKGWPEALNKVMKSSKPATLTGAATRKMIQVLASNIALLDSALVLQMVEDLIQVANREERGIKQKVAFQVVCQALVQGCSSAFSEASHSQAVQSIFSLLARKAQTLEATGSAQEIPEKWHIMSIADRLLPEQLLTEYIVKVSSGQEVNAEDSGMLAFHLKNFIEVLKSPPSFVKGEVWWNPERMDEASRDFVRLLLGLFNVTISGAGEGSNAVSYRALMSFLFKVHLEEPRDLFNFLSLLWTYNYSLSDPLSFSMNAVLQTQALYIGHALLTCQGAPKRKQLASATSSVVVSLLINLRSPVREVRRAAIGCLQCFSGLKDSPFHGLVQGLLVKAEEIIADPTYVSQALGTIFEEHETAASQKVKQKLFGLLELLLNSIKTASAPSYVAKILMQTLLEVNSEMVLSELLPAINRLLEKVANEPEAVLKDEALLLHLLLGKYNQHSAALLCKDPHSLDTFVKALHASTALQGTPTFQITALGQITKPFFAAIEDGKVQQRVLGVLFDLLLNCKNPLCAQVVTSAFKAIVVDAEQISQELEHQEKNKNLGTVRQTRRQKMLVHQKKKSQDAETVQEDESVHWQRTTLILELLQHKKKLKQPDFLVPTLFNLLSRCLEPVPSEQGSLEYTKQLILSCLLNICQKLSPDGGKVPADVLDEEKFNVELIVQCVRLSDVPQTHHHALLLLGAAAAMFPDKVLHNIMPIFTFMGANIMRLDDTYSFHVISKTVQTVIPALIQADGGDSGETSGQVEKVVSKIIHVFVDAMPHVPEHRRVPILAQLVDTVGGERFLWVLLVLLFEQHVTKTVTTASNSEKDAVLEQDMEFWISICCDFSVQDQLQSLNRMLQYLTKLPLNKDEDDCEKKKSKLRKSKSQEPEQHLFNVESHSGKQLRHFKFLSISFMAQLLTSHSFVGKVIECGESQELQDMEQRLLEDVLCYINVVANSVEKTSDQPTAKFWRALLNKSYDLLDKVNALLPTETFIPVIRGLMANQLPSVRRKAMELLNNKLQQRVQWQEEQIQLLLGLIAELLSIAHRKGGTEVEEEQAINRQTALYSLKLLCKCFGAQKQEAFVPVLTAAVDLISFEGPEERNVMGSALLCIAEVTSTLKALAIPQLPRLMPAVLKTLKHKKEMSSEIYLLSAVTALQKVAETLPHFLSPYLKDSLLQVARLEKIAAQVGPASQLYLRISSLKTTLSTKLASRVLLPTITKCYCDLQDTRQSSLGPLMEILKDHIAIMEKQQLVAQQTELTTFFLKALDFRAEHSEGDLQQVGQIEGHVINCLIIMVLKLSEGTFRPLFFKLFDWSKTEDALKDRQLTFYRLADCLADKLKGLFTLFAGHLVKPFASLLNQLNLIKTDEDFFDFENNEKSCLLLEFILDCLHKIFLYDTQRFVSKERAEALMMPLVDQLENQLGGEEKFQERVTKHLIPCIAQFSVAMADDSLWKPLNYQILLKMRHNLPKVRFAALIALVELVGKLRENYVVLLPESIPFLAELMEGNALIM
ncbi:HEAT repeat-containing protein 1 isoform X2 [Ambystoma mexicanum]|uniref:HEAT repeat-containing protein 1 isoform X2 n=1 Tax=Ambystoma mexicanum TaxID=8296 RepID=UPI0037E7A7DA